MIEIIREDAGPRLFNDWTLTHFIWGVVAAHFVPNFVGAIVLHSAYELVEGKIFVHRDESMRNHVGDTIGFTAGYLAASQR